MSDGDDFGGGRGSPRSRGTPVANRSSGRLPPKRKAGAGGDDGDARSRRRRGRDAPAGRHRDGGEALAARRFLDATEAQALGGDDGARHLELEPLAKLCYALSHRSARGDDERASRAPSPSRRALLAVAAADRPAFGDDDAAGTRAARRRRAAPRPPGTRATAPPAGDPSLAAPAAEPRGRDDDVAPFEDILVTTLKAAARAGDRLPAAPRAAARSPPAGALHALACAELSRVEGPRRLLAAAAEGLRAAGGRAIDEDGAADGDGPRGAVLWCAELATVARTVEERAADAGLGLETKKTKAAVEATCLDVAARLGSAVAAGADGGGDAPAPAGWRAAKKRVAAQLLGGDGDDAVASAALAAWAALGEIAERNESAESGPHARRTLDAVAAAAVLRGRRRASSVVLQCLASETASAGPVTMGATPRAVAGFARRRRRADRGAWAPLTLDPKTVLDGVAALAAAANARSSPSDAGAATAAPSKRKRRGDEPEANDDRPSAAFRDALGGDHAVALLCGVAATATATRRRDATRVGRRRRRGRGRGRRALPRRRRPFDAARAALVAHCGVDGAFDALMPRRAFVPLYEALLRDAGDDRGDAGALEALAALLLGDDGDLCPLAFAPRARFVVGALSSPAAAPSPRRRSPSRCAAFQRSSGDGDDDDLDVDDGGDDENDDGAGGDHGVLADELLAALGAAADRHDRVVDRFGGGPAPATTAATRRSGAAGARSRVAALAAAVLGDGGDEATGGDDARDCAARLGARLGAGVGAAPGAAPAGGRVSGAAEALDRRVARHLAAAPTACPKAPPLDASKRCVGALAARARPGRRGEARRSASGGAVRGDGAGRALRRGLWAAEERRRLRLRAAGAAAPRPLASTGRARRGLFARRAAPPLRPARGDGGDDWAVARRLALDDLEAWAQSPRAEHKANLALFFDGDAAGGDALGDAPGGDVEALVSWALDDDAGAAAEKAPKRKKAPPQLDAARPLEQLLVLAAALSNGLPGLVDALAKAASSEVQKRGADGPSLGVARTLELAAALVAGLCGAADALEPPRAVLPEPPPPVKAVEAPEPDALRCTYATSGGDFVDQHWYNCATCGLVGDKGCCSACARKCHAGHELSYSRKSSFFCDCGGGGGDDDGAARLGGRAGPRAPRVGGGGAAGGGAALQVPRGAGGGARARGAPRRRRRGARGAAPRRDRDALLLRVGRVALGRAEKLKPAAARALAALARELCDVSAGAGAAKPAAKPRSPRSRDAASVAGGASASSVQSTSPPRATRRAPRAPRRARRRRARAAAAARRRRRSPATTAPTAAPPQRRFAAVGGFDARGPGDVGSGPVARQLKALRRHVLLTALTNCLAPNGGDGGDAVRAAACALGRLSVAFDVAGVAFCPSSDRHLAVWGLRDCSVFALDGGARRGDAASATGEESKTDDAAARLCASAQIRVELALDALASDSAHVVKCAWVPRSSSCLVVATTLGVHVYDLAVDASTPTHAYVLAYDQHHVRDAVVTPPRHAWRGARALYVVLDTGRVFAADLEIAPGDDGDDEALLGASSFASAAAAARAAAPAPAAAARSSGRARSIWTSTTPCRCRRASLGARARPTRCSTASRPTRSCSAATARPRSASVWKPNLQPDFNRRPLPGQFPRRAPAEAAPGNDEYLVASRAEGGTFVARSERPGDVEVVRVLLGAASPEHVPRTLVVCGRRLDVSKDDRRWYDVALSDGDRRVCAALGGVALSLLGSNTAGNPPLLDALELYVAAPAEGAAAVPEAAAARGAAEDAAAHHPFVRAGPRAPALPRRRRARRGHRRGGRRRRRRRRRRVPRDGRDPFGGVVSLATKASKPNPLCRAALRLVEKTCLGESQRALAFAAATLVRVGCDFDGDAAALAVDGAARFGGREGFGCSTRSRHEEPELPAAKRDTAGVLVRLACGELFCRCRAAPDDDAPDVARAGWLALLPLLEDGDAADAACGGWRVLRRRDGRRPGGRARASTDGVDPTAPSPRKVAPMDESKDEDEDLCESKEAPAEDAGPDRVPVSRMTKGGFLVAAVLPLLLDRLRKHVVVACLDGGGAARTPGDLGCAIARYLATVLDVVARAWATGDAALARVLGARAAAFFAGELRYAACHDAVNKKRRRHARDLRRGDGVEWDGDADGSWFAPGEADDGSPDTLRGDVVVLLLRSLERLCAGAPPAKGERRGRSESQGSDGGSQALSQDERPPKDETTSPAKPPPVKATALRCAARRGVAACARAAVRGRGRRGRARGRAGRARGGGGRARRGRRRRRDPGRRARARARRALAALAAEAAPGGPADLDDDARQRATSYDEECGDASPLLLNADGDDDDHAGCPAPATDAWASPAPAPAGDDDDDDDDCDAPPAAGVAASALACAFLTAALGALASFGGAFGDAAGDRWPPAFVAAACDAVASRELGAAARNAAKRVLRRLCGGSGREYRACRDSHVFARHAAKLVGALRGLGERRELSYGATVALDASLRKLLRLARARSHHWRTFCSRPRLERPGDGANDDEQRGGTIVIDGDDDARDDDDAASLADASDDETDGDGFARAPCCALLERCAARGRRTTAAREDADAERDAARRAETRHRRRFARFLGYDKPAAAAAPGLSAACGLVALGAEAVARDCLAFSDAIVLDGDTRGCRALGAAVLRHCWAALPAAARRRVLEATARRAARSGARAGRAARSCWPAASARGVLDDVGDDGDAALAADRVTYVVQSGEAGESAGVVRVVGATSCQGAAPASPRSRSRAPSALSEATAEPAEEAPPAPKAPVASAPRRHRRGPALQALEDVRKGARFTESCSIAQLRGVRRIHAIELRLREPRGRYVRRLRVWYVAREVDSIGELAVPANWPKWSVAATARLTRGQTSVKIPLPAPLVAANLLFEYEDFYPQRTTPGGGAPRGGDRGRAGASGSRSGACLHCPRCGRAVTDAHGVCQHCGEVAFQCRQCRHINYERLDAFLCVECGYCAFGDFGYRLRSEAAPDALAIASAEELEAARRRLQDRAEVCRDTRATLRRLLPECARLARCVAGRGDGPDDDDAGLARCGGAWTAVDAASFALAATRGRSGRQRRARRGGFGRAARRRRAVAPVVAALFDRDQVLGCDAEPAAPPLTGGARQRADARGRRARRARVARRVARARAAPGRGPRRPRARVFCVGGVAGLRGAAGRSDGLARDGGPARARAALLGRVGAPPGAYGARRDGSLAALVESTAALRQGRARARSAPRPRRAPPLAPRARPRRSAAAPRERRRPRGLALPRRRRGGVRRRRAAPPRTAPTSSASGGGGAAARAAAPRGAGDVGAAAVLSGGPGDRELAFLLGEGRGGGDDDDDDDDGGDDGRRAARAPEPARCGAGGGDDDDDDDDDDEFRGDRADDGEPAPAAALAPAADAAARARRRRDCAALHGELRRAAREASETVARMRAWYLRDGGGEVPDDGDESDDGVALEAPRCSRRRRAVGRLAAVAGELAKRPRAATRWTARGRRCAARRRRARDDGGSRGVAARSASCALSGGARTAVFLELRRSRDAALAGTAPAAAGRALRVFRDHVAAPPADATAGGALFEDSEAFARETAKLAAPVDSPEAAEHVLRPALGVLCKLAASEGRGGGTLAWLRAELAAAPTAASDRRRALAWISPDMALRAAKLRRALRCLRGAPWTADGADRARLVRRAEPAAAAPKWRREDRYAFLAAACDLLRRRRAHRLHALAEEPPPRLSVASVEGLLRDMGDAVCPKKAKARVALQLRRAPTQEEFFRGNLPRSAVDLDDVPASTPRGAGGARRDDDDDGGGREPTMGDVRNKIAKDLDMADAAEMLELVVCDRIVNLDLPVRGVHARLWAPKANAPRSRAHRRQLGALAAALGGPSVGDDDDDDDVDDDDDDDMRDDDDGDDDDDDDDDEMDEDDVDDDDDDGDAHPLLDDDDDDELDDDDDEGAAHPAIAAAPRSPGSGDRSPKRRRRAKRQLPPMLVTYRLTGVDGEATEERLETLGGGGAKSDAADKYAATAAIAAADGLVELVRLVATGDEALVPRALSLLRMCAQVEAHARQLAELGAPGALLARLVSALKARSGATEMVEKLLSLLERLAPAAAEASSGGQASQTLSDDDGSHLETLVGGLGDPRVAAALVRTPALRKAVCRLLPALAYGKKDAADSLAARVADCARDLASWATCRGDDARVEASCLREAVEGLGGFGDHDALAPGAEDVGDALARVGFAKSLAEALAAALPKRFPKLAWAEKRADVASPADWVAALDAATPTIEACAPKHRGASLKAEALLDAVARSRHGGAAAAVVELRKASSDARSAYALKRRARTLKRLGLEAPEPAAAKAAPAPEEDPELGGPRCVVCREGFRSRPRDALGCYVFSKLAVADVGRGDGAFLLDDDDRKPRAGAGGRLASAPSGGSSRAAPPALCSSVSAMHCIHVSCHRDATRAERSLRSPRNEWDGATLRNSRVLCNSIVPLKPPPGAGGDDGDGDRAAAAAAYASAVDRHFSRAAQLGLAGHLLALHAATTVASPPPEGLRRQDQGPRRLRDGVGAGAGARGAAGPVAVREPARRRGRAIGEAAPTSPYSASSRAARTGPAQRRLYAKLALRRALDRARTRAAASAAARDHRRHRRGDDAPSAAAASPPASPRDGALDAATATRARTYAKSGLTYVALLDKLHAQHTPVANSAPGGTMAPTTKALALALSLIPSLSFRAPAAAPRTSTRRAANFHAEGDLSGDFQLSGLWKLERRPCVDEALPAAVPIQPSWSGCRWTSPARARVLADSVLVTLDSRGGFSTPPETPADRAVRGRWSCDGAELKMSRFGRHACNVVETYTGNYERGEGVSGTMLFGAVEPEYAGTFTMTQQLASLQPVVENVKPNRTTPLFKCDQIVGKWSLDFSSETSISAYEVVLYGNRTWETTSDLGNGAKLAGKWNLFDSGIDLTSGIDGSGGRIWLWLRRFGGSTAVTTGVHLNHDRLYIGALTAAPTPPGADDDAPPSPRRIKGQVAIGWSTEPAFIGSFRMKLCGNQPLVWGVPTKLQNSLSRPNRSRFG
ncbi:hypothetical protein JL722_1923 [Aureococcus anophagefferens]|nr:hypothetical protein JL722_1923 [Aureococcus anophagefferens]